MMRHDWLKKIGWRHFFKEFYPLLKPKGPALVLGFFLLASMLLATIPIPYLLKIIIDDVFSKMNEAMLGWIVGAILALHVLKMLLSLASSYVTKTINIGISVRLKQHLINRILDFPMSFFSNHSPSYLISRVSESDGFGPFFTGVAMNVLLGILEFGICLAILLSMNVKLTLVSLLCLPLFFSAIKYWSPKIRRINRACLEETARYYQNVQDVISGVEVVKCFSAETRVKERCRAHLIQLKKDIMKKDLVTQAATEVLALITAAGGLVVLWLSGRDILQGRFSIGDYVAFAAYLTRLYGPTQMLANLGVNLQPFLVSFDRMAELLSLVKPEDSDSGFVLKAVKGGIEFKNVFFRYDRYPVLTNVSFSIRAGEKALICGPNGSGKTTLIRLLMGFYRPDAGAILVDGRDIRTVSLSSLRKRIGFVSQNIFLFNDSIRNNVLFSNPSASEEKLLDAIAISGLDRVKDRFPEGLETIIGERGVRISGGERQMIAVARCLLRESDIVIFDEATAHLDKDIEAQIYDLLRTRLQEKTCILITHRRVDESLLDRILFMRDGTIFENAPFKPALLRI